MGGEATKTQGTQSQEQPEDIQGKLVETLARLEQRLEALEKGGKKDEGDKGGTKGTLDDILADLDLIDDEDVEGGKDVRDKEQDAPKGQAQQPIDLERLSSTELANYIVAHVHESYIKPLIEQLEYMRLKDEIKEVSSEHEDFWDHKDAVFRILEKRPQLSVKEAYAIVTGLGKRQSKAADKEGEKDEREKGEKAQSKKQPVFGGERPGVSRKAATEDETLSIRDAFERAFEEVSSQE